MLKEFTKDYLYLQKILFTDILPKIKTIKNFSAFILVILIALSGYLLDLISFLGGPIDNLDSQNTVPKKPGIFFLSICTFILLLFNITRKLRLSETPKLELFFTPSDGHIFPTKDDDAQVKFLVRAKNVPLKCKAFLNSIQYRNPQNSNANWNNCFEEAIPLEWANQQNYGEQDIEKGKNQGLNVCMLMRPEHKHKSHPDEHYKIKICSNPEAGELPFDATSILESGCDLKIAILITADAGPDIQAILEIEYTRNNVPIIGTEKKQIPSMWHAICKTNRETVHMR